MGGIFSFLRSRLSKEDCGQDRANEPELALEFCESRSVTKDEILTKWISTPTMYTAGVPSIHRATLGTSEGHVCKTRAESIIFLVDCRSISEFD